MQTLPFDPSIDKILLSAPAKNGNSPYTRVEIVKGDVQGESLYQASLFTATQVFHKNLPPNQVVDFVEQLLGPAFTQYTAYSPTREYQAKITKKGKRLTTSRAVTGAGALSLSSKNKNIAKDSFNKIKNHLIMEGEPIPALVDMGVFTKDYKVVKGMYDKFQQINRFVELVADETKNIPAHNPIQVIDFGCGKSYLTFVLYYFFAVIEQRPIQICGLDLKEDVIQKCNATAIKYNYPQLTFHVGDIGSQHTPPLANWGKGGAFTIVISLHACDTATDHALYNAIQWGADLIFAAPCCQHEIRKQMQKNMQKNNFPRHVLQAYGIIEERVAALITDTIRAKLLEYMGYKTQIIEFIDLGHTPKNLLIRARRRKKNNAQAAGVLQEIQQLTVPFLLEPTLMGLLCIQTGIQNKNSQEVIPHED